MLMRLFRKRHRDARCAECGRKLVLKRVRHGSEVYECRRRGHLSVYVGKKK